MAITNFLNLADVYAAADRSKAMQQEATLRDLKINEAHRAEQERLTLENLSKQPGMFDPEQGYDYGRMAEGAARAGAYKPSMELFEKGRVGKEKQAEYSKKQTEFLGQIAAVNEAPNPAAAYKELLVRANDPSLSKELRTSIGTLGEKYPEYNKEAANVIRQINLQAISAKDREHNALFKERLDLRASQAGGLKASDSNALRAAIASHLGVPFTRDALGNVTISALDPDKAQKLMQAEELGATYFLGDPQVRGNHLGAAARASREVMGGAVLPPAPGQPAPRQPLPGQGVTKPVPDNERQAFLSAWQDPAKRQGVLNIMKKYNYDQSFLATGSATPGVVLPESTIRSTSAVEDARRESETEGQWLRSNRPVFRQLQNSRMTREQAQAAIERIQLGLGSRYFKGEDRILAEEALNNLMSFVGQ